MILNPGLQLYSFSAPYILCVQILELYPVFTDFMLDTKEIFKSNSNKMKTHYSYHIKDFNQE